MTDDQSLAIDIQHWDEIVIPIHEAGLTLGMKDRRPLGERQVRALERWLHRQVRRLWPTAQSGAYQIVDKRVTVPFTFGDGRWPFIIGIKCAFAEIPDGYNMDWSALSRSTKTIVFRRLA